MYSDKLTLAVLTASVGTLRAVFDGDRHTTARLVARRALAARPKPSLDSVLLVTVFAVL